jgi:hypothetical protein
MLFYKHKFISHAGIPLDWKIECDDLTAESWAALALMASRILPSFGSVEGVPRGGLAFADALRPYATGGLVLIADDVGTTGKSMEDMRAGRDAIGIVAFARGPLPRWIGAVFRIDERLWTPRMAPSRR